jgi:putative transposase
MEPPLNRCIASRNISAIYVAIREGCRGRRNSAATGTKPRPGSRRFTLRSLTPGRTSCSKTTTTISKNHAMVVIEDLEVRNLSRSSRGTSDQPGSKVRQKAGLNRSILDQGWSEFRRQLEYKMLWKGGVLLAVPARNTSRTCPYCGHVAKENRKTQAKFECIQCGHNNNADVVGAINILERGHRLFACGGDLLEARGPRKQEPAEMVA